MGIEIVPVKGLGKFLAFCRLPRQIYKGLPGFSAPLDAERWTAFAAKFNPHFKLVESQAFLARKDGRWVGRIVAQVYKDTVSFRWAPRRRSSAPSTRSTTSRWSRH